MRTNELKGPALVALIVLLTSFAHVTARHMNAKNPCENVGGPASEETRCFVEEAQRADRELNLVYNKVRTVLTSTEQQQLQATQRLWIQFRDANCTAERDL